MILKNIQMDLNSQMFTETNGLSREVLQESLENSSITTS